MEKELLHLFDAAKKAADSAASDAVSSNSPEVYRCVDALNQLKDFPVTYDTLVSSKVGKKLRPLTKHPREKIKTVASDLLELWKRIVIEETTKSKKNGTTSAVKVEKLQKPSAVKSEKLSRTESVKVENSTGDSVKSVKVEKREANGDTAMDEKRDRSKLETIYKDERQASNVKKSFQSPACPPKLTSMVKCDDPLRDKFREILVEALSKVASEADEDMLYQVNAADPIRVAVSVESVMFEKMGKSNGAQKFKYRSIMFNMKDPKNPDFRRKVLLGEVKPERLITMTPEEMASDERQRENKEIKEKALFDCERGGAPKATTDQFKCGRCGQRKTTYYQMQTRSADEPMTTYVTCVNCNNHWKFC
ncbi:Transcription elongation factor TFIIS [Hibiscus syriacus]|uniref:Transcription elongation factor n=1 Tax=Hibiscus syriacus TaxID=106335 RepID=A0A6A3BRA9_HIBSY|nr:transcription elongation factor TFIIS-like [Hibiscus syriacus]XP_039067801.1 transcription elongation factor TFIIS-like [Hibiscus syriacus]XP_039067802.1 transcription elongation factor TFIIS-like [Hibiscus syriacus]KAE8717592.1 Transcription elongation factor TFIIS [Hibiscus syriacus]